MKDKILLWFIPALAAGLALNSIAAIAGEQDAGVFGPIAQPVDTYSTQARDSARWGFAYDNDFFVPGGRDQDYTYGLSMSYSNRVIEDDRWHKPLDAIDGLLGFASGSNVRYGFEGGLYGFTPEDTSVAQANTNDRPYASLVYFSTYKERMNVKQESVLRTQLSIGVLGLELVGQIQDETHKLIGNERPQGWDNQISSGGEPTFRYVVSMQNKIHTGSSHFELRQSKAASIGYLTEASWGMSFRAGKLNSSWSDFNPELASYAESSSATVKGFSERFIWGGVAIKARGYNAFMQGQFRDSPVTIAGDDLNHAILEAWAGYTHSFASGYYISYGVRGHSSEVRSGPANRNVVWGGLMLGKRII